MIGLGLSGCVHKKWVKWGKTSILLPLVFDTYSYILYFVLGEDWSIFCCTGSRENYFGSVGWQNNNNLKFHRV